MATTSRFPHRTLVGRILLLCIICLPTVSLADPLPSPGAWRAETSATAESTPPWRWPMASAPHVVRPFEPPASRYGPGHRGIDLAMEPGHPVTAVAAGVVTHSGMVAGRGTVTVRHEGGLASTYEPIGDRITLGSVVETGDLLGRIEGESHCSPTSCLHLGARLGEEYLDPLLLLAQVRIVLLPLLTPTSTGGVGGP